MSTVDNRVVEMQFDDADFTPGIKKAIDALGQLQQALKLDVPKNGMTALSSNTIAVSGAFEGLQYTIAKTANSFSTLEVAALMALNNIVNRAVDAGLRIAKSLTIDQVTQGFGEYELKMNSIQTIMAGTGEPLERVNELLDELNHYADKTIYSFSDMTANIGKFTNAGVKLETAVDAIQGVSNLAALSGANANEASRAMYNFAQALSAGYVKLIDWKSIENANMATVEFKNQLLETALALGTVRKEGDMYVTTTTSATGSVSAAFDATHNFNDALAHQWLTTEVLTTTLSKYVDETTEIGKRASKAATEVRTWTILVDALKEAIGSGWARTFELIFGDYHEATKFWTELSQAITSVIEPISEFRNRQLELWRDSSKFGVSGRDQLMEGLFNNVKYLQKIFEPFNTAVYKVFFEGIHKSLEAIIFDLHKMGRVNIRSISDVFEVWNTSGFSPEYIQKKLDAIQGTWAAFFTTIKRVGKGVADIFSRIGNAFYSVTMGYAKLDILKLVQSVTGWMNRLTLALAPAEDNLMDVGVSAFNILHSIQNVFKGLLNIVGFLADLLSPIITAFKYVMGTNRVLTEITDPVHQLSSDFLAFTESLSISQETANNIRNTFTKVFQTIHDVVVDVVTAISNFVYLVKTGGSVVDKKFSPILVALAKVVRTVITVITGLIGGIALFISKLDFRKIAEQVTKRIESIREWLGKLYEKFKANENISRFLDLIQQAKDYISNLIETVKNTGSFEAFGSIIDDLSESFKNLQNETGFIGGAARALQAAIDTITGAVEYIKTKLEAIKKLFDELGITGGFEKMIQGILNLDSSTFAEGFSEFGTGIKLLIEEHIVPAVEEGMTSVITAVTSFLDSEDGMPAVLEKVKSFFSIDALSKKFSDLGSDLAGSGLFDNVFELIQSFVTSVLSVFGIDEDVLGGAFSTLWWFLGGVTDIVKHFGDIAGRELSDVGGTLGTIFGDVVQSFLEVTGSELIDDPEGTMFGILKLLASGEAIAILDGVRAFTFNLGKLVQSVSGVFTGMSNMFKGIGRAFRGIGRFFDAGAVLQIAISVLILAKAMEIIANIPEERLLTSLGVIAILTVAVALLFAFIASINATKPDDAADAGKSIRDMFAGFAEGFKGLNTLFTGLGVAAIVGSVLILVFAMKQVIEMLQTVDSGTIITIAISILAVVGALAWFANKLSEMNNGTSVLAVGLGILAISFAVKLLTESIRELATGMDVNTYANGLVKVAGILLTLAVAAGILGAFGQGANAGMMIGAGIAILAMAFALKLVVGAMKTLAKLASEDPNALLLAWVSVMLLITMLAIAMAGVAEAASLFEGGLGKFIGVGIAFVLLAVALNIVVNAIATLAALTSKNDIVKPLIALSVICLVMAGSLALVAGVSGMVGVGALAMLAVAASFVIVAIALRIIADAISAIASTELDPALLWNIVGALSVMLLVMGLVLVGLTALTGGMTVVLIPAALGMLILSAAVWVLAQALDTLASHTGEELNSAILALAEALGLLLLASFITMIPGVSESLIVLAGAMLAIGAAALDFGVGAELLIDSMERASNIKANAFDGIGEAIDRFLSRFDGADALTAGGLGLTLGPLMDKLGQLVGYFDRLDKVNIYRTSLSIERILNSISSYEGSPNLQEFVDFLEKLSNYGDVLAGFSTFADSSSNMIGKIGDTLPKLVETEQSFIDTNPSFISALDDLAQGLYDFRDKATGVSGIMSELSTSMGNLVAVMAGIIEANANQVSPAGAALVNALMDGIEEEIEPAKTKFANAADRIRLAAESAEILGRFENAGTSLIATLMLGMDHKMGPIHDKGYALASSARDGAAKDSYDNFKGVGTNMGWGMVAGLNDGTVSSAVYGAAYALAQTAVKGAKEGSAERSPSKLFMQIGSFMSEGLAIGITDSEGLAEKAAFNMARAVSMVAQDSIDEINASKYDIYLNPVIDDAGLNSLSSGLMLNGMNFGILGNTIAALNQNGTNGDLLAELQRVHRDLVEVASRPTTSIQMGDINTYDDQAMQDATKSYITRLATLKGGM